MIDINDYCSGGYFLVRAGKPIWEQLKTDLLPEKIISLSNCICSKLCIYWGWTPGNRRAAIQFGIPEAKLDDFIHWCASDWQTDLDIVSMFYSADSARRFVKQFQPNTDDLYLIGTGLPKDLEEANWREPGDENTCGVEKRIEQQLPIEPGGTVLGFEVVSYSYSNYGHSWLCSYLFQDMYELYGIRPNQYGLIESDAEARKIYEWINEDKMQGTRAEPEPYDYWLLVSYPLSID